MSDARSWVFADWFGIVWKVYWATVLVSIVVGAIGLVIFFLFAIMAGLGIFAL